MPVHAIMCPPKVYGTVTKVYGASTDGHEEFNLTDPVGRGVLCVGGVRGVGCVQMRHPHVRWMTQVLEVEHPVSGKRMQLTMSHFWPVRKPRPVSRKLPGQRALITGQRVLDVLYPCVMLRSYKRQCCLSCCAIPSMPQVCARWNMCNPWRVWLRKNVHLPGSVEVLQHRCHRLRRVWRAGERNGGGAVRFPRTYHGGGRQRSRHLEAYLPCGKYIQHACCCPRSVHLHGYHHCRVRSPSGCCVGTLLD